MTSGSHAVASLNQHIDTTLLLQLQDFGSGGRSSQTCAEKLGAELDKNSLSIKEVAKSGFLRAQADSDIGKKHTLSIKLTNKIEISTALRQEVADLKNTVQNLQFETTKNFKSFVKQKINSTVDTF